jgi:hypothetical protein
MLAMAGDDPELLDIACEVETELHRVESVLNNNA